MIIHKKINNTHNKIDKNTWYSHMTSNKVIMIQMKYFHNFQNRILIKRMRIWTMGFNRIFITRIGCMGFKVAGKVLVILTPMVFIQWRICLQIMTTFLIKILMVDIWMKIFVEISLKCYLKEQEVCKNIL